MRLVRPALLTTREPFSTIFPIQDHILAAIKERMEAEGFDYNEPISVWELPNELIVLDGHTRLRAAIEADLDTVAIGEYAFEDEDAALRYAIKRQRDRRNLTDADLLRLVAELDKRRERGGDRRGEDFKAQDCALIGKSAEDTAALLGASPRKVEQVRTVLDHADEETKAAVESGEKSVNAAYNETQERRKSEQEAEGSFIYTCDTCGKELAKESWHCPCGRHWPEDRAKCPKCNHVHGYRQRGTPVPVAIIEPDEPFVEEVVTSPEPVIIPLVLESPEEKPAKAKTAKPTFNYQTSDGIEWAKWSWNPVTGCLHDCGYCYAREIANRYYPEKFKPTYHPERLKAPHNTKQKPAAATNIGERNVFVGSMADLFGHWVPQEWIDAVLEECRDAPQWNFLFLTKNPKRYVGIDWPANSWVGTTVDEQKRVLVAERAFARIKAPVKFLSCEPLLEPLTFTSLEMFDWIIIGGQSANSQVPEFQPPWEWVESLLVQARAAGCKVYLKPNLTTRPKEYPEGAFRVSESLDPKEVQAFLDEVVA